MADVVTPSDFLSAARKSGLLTEAQLTEVFEGAPPPDPRQCAAALVKCGKLTTYQAAQLLAGKTRGFKLGPYTLLKPLGQGGMGVVYLADHAPLGRKVAIKVLPPDKARDQINRERFHREARASAALDHPNIVRLHDIGCEGGLHFLVFEYVEGRDLQSLMSETGPLHFAQAAHYIAQAAAGLHHAHQRGLVHRDIKPSNLILAKDGSVKLLDMGLARSFSDKRDDLTGTLGDEGDIVGTVDFLSPEQCRNALIDERSDVYSLGATLFTLVAGHPPFSGSTAQKMMQHQLAAPPALERLRAKLPEALCDVMARMMAKAPGDRYQTAEDVALALGPWVPAPTTGVVMGGSATLPEFQTGNSSMRRRAGLDAPGRGRKPLLVAAIGLLGALSVGAVLALALGRGTPPAGPPTSEPAPAATPTPAAAPAPVAARGPTGGHEVFRLSATDVAPFRHTREGGTEGPKPKLPTGVSFFPHKRETVGEFFCAVIDGQPALGWANLRGEPSGQIAVELNQTDPTRAPLINGKRYVSRVTYKTTGGATGFLYIQTQKTYKIVDHSWTNLPDTKGEWSTVAVDWVKPENEVRMLVDNASVGADKIMYAREVTVHEAPMAGSLAPPAEPLVPPAASALYSLDLSQQKPFRLRGRMKAEGGNRIWVPESKTGDGALPPGWLGRTPRNSEAEGELYAEQADGRTALGFRTTQGTDSMILFTPAIEFKCPKVRLTVEYRTDPGAVNGPLVRILATQPQWGSGRDVVLLPSTEGQWRIATHEIDVTGIAAGALEFHNNNGGGRAILLRAVAVADPVRAAPVARPAGRTVYALDLSQQKPFVVSGTCEPTGNKAEDVRFVERTREGNGAMPTGWRGMPWDATSEAAFFAQEKGGRMALGMRNVRTGTRSRAAFTGMLFSPRMKLPDGPFRLRFSYLTDADGPIELQVKLKPTAPDARLNDGAAVVLGLDSLPGTGGRWAAKELDVDPMGATEGYIEFHSFDLDTARGFYLGEFSIAELAPAAAFAPAAAPAGPIKVDFGAFKEGTFAFTANAAEVAGRTNIEAEGWWFNEFLPGATGELVVATEGGSRFVTLVNKTGEASAQLFQTKPGPALAGGRQYLLKFEYRAAAGTSGRLEVRERDVGNWKDCPYSYALDSTGGKWEQRTFELDVLRDYPTVFVVQNLTAGAGNSLSIRKLEVVPVGGP